MPLWCFLITSIASGNCRKMTRIFPGVGVRSRRWSPAALMPGRMSVTSVVCGKGGSGNTSSGMRVTGEITWITSITIRSGMAWSGGFPTGRGHPLQGRLSVDGTLRIGVRRSRRQLPAWIWNDFFGNTRKWWISIGGCVVALLIHPTNYYKLRIIGIM